MVVVSATMDGTPACPKLAQNVLVRRPAKEASGASGGIPDDKGEWDKACGITRGLYGMNMG